MMCKSQSSFPTFSHDVQIARSYRAEGATSAKREAAEEGFFPSSAASRFALVAPSARYERAICISCENEGNEDLWQVNKYRNTVS